MISRISKRDRLIAVAGRSLAEAEQSMQVRYAAYAILCTICIDSDGDALTPMKKKKNDFEVQKNSGGLSHHSYKHSYKNINTQLGYN